jgi:hypothetical protein
MSTASSTAVRYGSKGFPVLLFECSRVNQKTYQEFDDPFGYHVQIICTGTIKGMKCRLQVCSLNLSKVCIAYHGVWVQ